MKETKVYVDELPEDCTDCPCYDFDIGGCQCKDPHFTYQSIDRFKGCPLIDIKTHDRELVKEVCDKIARNVRVRKIQEEWYAFETDLRAVLDQIQKEAENE